MAEDISLVQALGDAEAPGRLEITSSAFDSATNLKGLLGQGLGTLWTEEPDQNGVVNGVGTVVRYSSIETSNHPSTVINPEEYRRGCRTEFHLLSLNKESMPDGRETEKPDSRTMTVFTQLSGTTAVKWRQSTDGKADQLLVDLPFDQTAGGTAYGFSWSSPDGPQRCVIWHSWWWSGWFGGNEAVG
ncbi:hypothetical protein HPP92_028848 [Vanilla planifolia]|uniref:Uncharacterized protein n=1 Tax=Vanilla planifolia TaxID=51239 RepID=A0A835P3W2_VANPL|nr:hypothetical protein HPP92_028848 [Vanilla planifolia]KAG0446420.1 hypothetical protein HPP92_028837 [Vanilla planifolia]